MMDLAVSRRTVTSRRPVRNWPWLILSFPFRVLLAFWNWVMESKPKSSYRFRR